MLFDVEVAGKPLTFCTQEMIEFTENPVCIENDLFKMNKWMNKSQNIFMNQNEAPFQSYPNITLTIEKKHCCCASTFKFEKINNLYIRDMLFPPTFQNLQ